jgi:type III secretion apparatus needle protein
MSGINNGASGSVVNYQQISDTMGGNTKAAADALKSAMEYAKSEKGKNDPNAMFQVQEAMQKWSMANSMQATIVQMLGESMKGIIQKMG